MSSLPIIKNKKAKSMKIPISEVRVMDILSDRGKNFTHPGNMYFRCLAQTAVERNRRNPSCTLRPVILVDAMIMFLRGKGVRFLKVQRIDGSKSCYEELCRILTIDKIRNNLRDFVVKDIVAEYPFKDDGAALKEWEAVLDGLCLKHGAPPAANSSPCVSATKPVVVPALVKSPDYITERVHISPPFMASPWAGRSGGDTPPSMEQLMPQQGRYYPSRIYPPTHLESHNATSFSRNMAHEVNRDIFGFNNYSHGMSSGIFFKNQREADAAMSVVMALRRKDALGKQIHEHDIPANMAFDSWLERR